MRSRLSAADTAIARPLAAVIAIARPLAGLVVVIARPLAGLVVVIARPLAALVVVLTLAEAPARTEATWTYASSTGFEVYTTGGERVARDALVYFERVRTFFTEFLKLSPRSGTPTRLIIFSGAKEYAPYRPNEVATAYYQPGPDRDYIVMRSFDVESFPLVVHEYAHLVFRHAGAAYPPWLNEGLAEFSTLAPEAGQVRLGRVPIQRLQYLAGGVKLIPLQRLLVIDHDAPEYNTKLHAGVFYSESWALTHMLLTVPKYQAKSTKFLDLMAGGADGPATLESVYGTSVIAVQKELTGYIGQSSYRYFIASYKAPKDIAAQVTRAATPFEAALATANLLAVTRDRDAEARSAFETLGRQQPDSLPLAESRAFFELRRHQDAATIPFLARAVDLGSRNAELYRNYAYLVEADQPDRAEALLRKAVSFDPDDMDARLSLAETLFRMRRPDEALHALDGVTRVSAGDAYRFFRILASANAMLDKMDDAKAAAAKLQQFARPGPEARYAAEVAASINEYIVRRAEVEKALREATTSRAAPAATASGAAPTVAEIQPPKPRDTPLTPGEVLGDKPALYANATGRLKNLVCGSAQPILEVLTSTGTLRLVIDNPDAIRILGKDGPQADLSCGEQDVPLKVAYDPRVDPVRKTVGNVRVLDFRR